MSAFYADDLATLFHGDCLDVMAGMEPDSVDAVVCDPPYELGFMGRAWDASGVAYRPETWAAALRVLKPGGHLLAFGGTRTYHRMAVAIEDAGFEVRDCIAWMYGSGFPKSLDVSKAIDKAAGAEREVTGRYVSPQFAEKGYEYDAVGARERHKDVSDRNVPVGNSDWEGRVITAPATPEAERWSGWGTALKPAHEPIVVARKPLTSTVAGNVLEWGTGGLNIDGCRVGRSDGDRTEYGRDRHLPHANTTESLGKFAEVTPYTPNEGGRWPANVVLDPEAAAILDAQSGALHTQDPETRNTGRKPGWSPSGAERPDLDKSNPNGGLHETGTGASRFYYTAKASKADRGPGNTHPTVKPVELMRWLVRLVTPPGGTVLDPFAGSGSTLVAAVIEGFRCVGIEREDEYADIIRRRLTAPISPVLDFGGDAA